MPTLKRGEIKNSVSVSDSGTSSAVPPSDDDLGIDSYPGSENAVLNKPSCSRYGPENQPTSSIKPLPEIEGSYNNNLKDEQFKRQVLRNLSILNFKLDQLAEDVGRISLKQKREVIVSPSVFSKFNFPLSTEEELHIFENHLADGEKYI